MIDRFVEGKWQNALKKNNYELIRDVLLWTPTHGRAKAGRPALTYIQQLCEDTGCCPEDLPSAMNDREEWRERVRDIRATSATWWWWLQRRRSKLFKREPRQISRWNFFFFTIGQSSKLLNALQKFMKEEFLGITTKKKRKKFILPSRLIAAEYTDWSKTPATSVLNMTQNNLMVRSQWCWSFGEYRAPLHCHRFQVYTDTEW